MTKHLNNELENLKRMIFSLAAAVEKQLALAVKAVGDRDDSTARLVIEEDVEIDQAEVATEEQCLRLLALHQPVAIDLRFIVSVLKLNNDLERIGDLAVNIAERAVSLSRLSSVPLPFNFDGMAAKTRDMLDKSLNALVNRDVEAAKAVCLADDEVDAINREVYEKVESAIRKHPDHIKALIHLLSVSKYLERIADHATNIAEDLIYLVEGRIARHHLNVTL